MVKKFLQTLLTTGLVFFAFACQIVLCSDDLIGAPDETSDAASFVRQSTPLQAAKAQELKHPRVAVNDVRKGAILNPAQKKEDDYTNAVLALVRLSAQNRQTHSAADL